MGDGWGGGDPDHGNAPYTHISDIKQFHIIIMTLKDISMIFNMDHDNNNNSKLPVKP